MLIKIARCGHSVPILQGGTVRVIRDSLQSLPVSMFCSRNIVRASFNISYIMPSDDTADAVIVEYFNHRTWRPDQVTCKLESSQEEKPAVVSLFGCTSAPHAQREGNYIVADNCYRRKIVTFRTELDGMIPTYGDLSCHPCDMLFYIDPPYYGCEDDYGVNMFDRDQFAIMAKILAGVSGRFILSKKRSSHYTAIVQSI